MQRGLLFAVLVACKGSKAPSEDKRPPAPVPIVADAQGDPAATCYRFPFGLDAERAGIRRLAHRPTPLPSVTVSRESRYPTFERAIELAPGAPTEIDLTPTPNGPPFTVPGIGANSMVATAKVAGGGVTVTAPAHLDGAVLEITGQTFARAQIGENGRRALDLYHARYVLKRYADQEGRYHLGRKLTALWPSAIIADDVDGDGKPELVALSRVDVQGPDSDRPYELPGMYDLAIIWLDSEDYTHTWLDSDATLYVVPPGLAGGKPMFVASANRPIAGYNSTRFSLTRVVLDGRKLVQLDKSDEEDVSYEDAPSPDDLCLQASASTPARWTNPPEP